MRADSFEGRYLKYTRTLRIIVYLFLSFSLSFFFSSISSVRSIRFIISLFNLNTWFCLFREICFDDDSNCNINSSSSFLTRIEFFFWKHREEEEKKNKYRDVAGIYIAWLYLRKSYEINVEIEIFSQIFLSYGFLKFLFLN